MIQTSGLLETVKKKKINIVISELWSSTPEPVWENSRLTATEVFFFFFFFVYTNNTVVSGMQKQLYYSDW